MSTVAKRYTPALMDVAREAGVLAAVLADVRGLLELLETSQDFAEFVRNPLIPAEQQQTLLSGLFEGKVNVLTLNFLRLLAEKERLTALPDILVEVGRAMDGEQGVLDVQVRSAVALSAAQEKALSDKLNGRTGKTVRLRQEVDPSLLGGFLLRIGDQIEDYSLAAKLQRFQQNILNA
jgi:F-type H+-transporting ATPase subunit delta